MTYSVGDMVKMVAMNNIGIVVDITWNGKYVHVHWLHASNSKPQPYRIDYAHEWIAKL